MISVFDRKEECCGCTACMNICPTKAIKMVEDEEGFLYPKIDQALCINCGKCRKVCPFQNEINISNKLSKPTVYAVKHNKESVRMKSSSGGVFTAISDYVLNNGGVVYGAAFDENFNVIHKKAETSEECNKFRGSKYVQSDLSNVYKQIKDLLKSDRQVLFSGTPCQTAGLKSFLTNSRTNTDNLIINDIVCHGTPSPKIWLDYIDFIEKGNKLKSYSFRFKERGWHGYNIMAEYKNGKRKINTKELKIFTNLFSSDLLLRPSCHNCKFANIDRKSDITIGDFWGIEKTMPGIDDNKGISLALVNTVKGEQVFEKIKENIDFWENKIEDSLQPNLISPTKKPLKREVFWEYYYKNGFLFIAKKYGGYNFKSYMKSKIRYVLQKTGTFNLIKSILGKKKV
ncbi:MAG: Coenzyme F420 hydrogenase/dehydrogenase, beta subunit C-terminal domain [Bacilli bacterium]|nr:Coenzyme F420 hydrogenase/dehydrogenase, beta subunit C-terminal domain [Bacilli bacterium]MDD4733546.1 Coenzyme F420 hydrogenase/dehydrogenase, beta subunit C-terminal domain [Bacilli bacterium]